MALKVPQSSQELGEFPLEIVRFLPMSQLLLDAAERHLGTSCNPSASAQKGRMRSNICHSARGQCTCCDVPLPPVELSPVPVLNFLPLSLYR